MVVPKASLLCVHHNPSQESTPALEDQEEEEDAGKTEEDQSMVGIFVFNENWLVDKPFFVQV